MALLTKREVVDGMGICDSTLWRWIKNGTFPPPSRKITNKKQWWDSEYIEQWLDERREKEIDTFRESSK